VTTECPECMGTTWVSVRIGGKKIGRRCSCYINSEKSRLLNSARIPTRYRHCSIGNFQTKGQKNLNDVTDLIREFVSFFPSKNQKGLLFIGPPGVGKTHLAVGIVHYLIEDRDVKCVFYDFRELLNDIRSTYDSSSQLTERAVIRPLLECELLVLDELGAEKTTDWVRDILMYILNHRYNNMKTTIITTNYPDSDRSTEDKKSTTGKKRKFVSESYKDHKNAKEESLVDRIGFRLRSRLREMCQTINITGSDYRLNQDVAAFNKGIRDRLLQNLEE